MRVRWGRIVLLLIVGIGALAGCALALTAWQLFSQPASVSDGSEPSATTARATSASSRPTKAVATGGSTAQPVAPGEPFDVLTLQYTPYMATLALMDAKGYMEAEGYDLRLHDVYADDVALDEEGQCSALKSGDYDALATTLDATRKCGEGVAVGVPIGQSAGNDAIVVKPGVSTWNDVFEHTIGFTGYSVSEYMACFASHTAGASMKFPERFDDAGGAVDAWLNEGPEQDMQSVVAWEPEIARALSSLEGSKVLLSSRDVRILWDVVEFATANANASPEAYAAFTRAYYRALKDVTEDPKGSLAALVAWAGDDEARNALLTTTDPDEFVSDLNNEAFATLQDAGVLMTDMDTLLNRLDEAAFYWTYCNVPVPEVADEARLVLPQFVLGAREDRALATQAGRSPSAEVFQVTDFTNAAAVSDTQIEEARVLFEAGIPIEFLPNRTDFREPNAANEVLNNAVRFLRTCQDCVLEIQGGAAYPGEAVCPACRPADSDALAVQRGERVYRELLQRFEVPEAQLRFKNEPHPPQYPGSNREDELQLDRRTFLVGLQLAGR